MKALLALTSLVALTIAPALAQPLMGPATEANPNVEIALGYIETVWVGHDPVAGFELYVDPASLHHPGEPGGSDPQALAGFLAAFPNFHYEVRQVFADGEFVIVHSWVTGVPGTGETVHSPQPGVADQPKTGDEVVDIFRIREGLIIEHWDIIEQIGGPADGLF